MVGHNGSPVCLVVHSLPSYEVILPLVLSWLSLFSITSHYPPTCIDNQYSVSALFVLSITSYYPPTCIDIQYSCLWLYTLRHFLMLTSHMYWYPILCLWLYTPSPSDVIPPTCIAIYLFTLLQGIAFMNIYMLKLVLVIHGHEVSWQCQSDLSKILHIVTSRVNSALIVHNTHFCHTAHSGMRKLGHHAHYPLG